jgi:preprotein translocase subunit SecE
LRQVAWPNRSEMLNYTAVVVTTLVLMVTLIFILNFGFGKTVLFMFHK